MKVLVKPNSFLNGKALQFGEPLDVPADFPADLILAVLPEPEPVPEPEVLPLEE